MVRSSYSQGVNEYALIRLTNLKSLKQKAAELSVTVGGSQSYWTGVLARTRPFGEKTARKIEAAYDLPRGWLDEAHDGPVARLRQPGAATLEDRRDGMAHDLLDMLKRFDNADDLRAAYRAAMDAIDAVSAKVTQARGPLAAAALAASPRPSQPTATPTPRPRQRR